MIFSGGCQETEDQKSLLVFLFYFLSIGISLKKRKCLIFSMVISSDVLYTQLLPQTSSCTPPSMWRKLWGQAARRWPRGSPAVCHAGAPGLCRTLSTRDAGGAFPRPAPCCFACSASPGTAAAVPVRCEPAVLGTGSPERSGAPQGENSGGTDQTFGIARRAAVPRVGSPGSSRSRRPGGSRVPQRFGCGASGSGAAAGCWRCSCASFLTLTPAESRTPGRRHEPELPSAAFNSENTKC